MDSDQMALSEAILKASRNTTFTILPTLDLKIFKHSYKMKSSKL